MPQQRKVKKENIHIVRDCADGKISCAEAAERCGMAFETMRRWASRYRAEGAAAFFPTQRNSIYTPELKEAAVKAYLSGEGSLQKISKNTTFVIQSSSDLGLRCIIVIRTSRNRQEEAV